MLTEVNYQSETVELMRALQQGRKIEAIKAFRMLTGHGLKESKDQIEASIDGVIKNYRRPEDGHYVVVDTDVIHHNYYNAAEEAKRSVGAGQKQYIARIETQISATIVEEQYVGS